MLRRNSCWRRRISYKMPTSWLVAVTVTTLSFLTSGVQCRFRIQSLEIPDFAWTGDRVEFHCDFELDRSSPYTVNWYKDDVEFFRYISTNSPPIEFFPMRGIDVDVQTSNDTVIHLRHVTPSTSGTYRCEVTNSGVAGGFKTLSKALPFKVFDPVPHGRTLGRSRAFQNLPPKLIPHLVSFVVSIILGVFSHPIE